VTAGSDIGSVLDARPLFALIQAYRQLGPGDQAFLAAVARQLAIDSRHRSPEECELLMAAITMVTNRRARSQTPGGKA